MPTSLYECHITINPVFGDELTRIENLASVHRFKVAKLVMVKEGRDNAPSKRDTFMTAHSSDLDDIKMRMEETCKLLLYNGCAVLRYKIEEILSDSRTDDYLGIIKPEVP